jgi:hypothetical protein
MIEEKRDPEAKACERSLIEGPQQSCREHLCESGAGFGVKDLKLMKPLPFAEPCLQANLEWA